jgi:hypothetical protein
VVFTGTARIDSETLPANQVPDYAQKYQAGFQRIDLTSPSLADRCYGICAGAVSLQEWLGSIG